MSSNSSKKSRAFVFTINNYTEEDYERVFSTNHQYIIVGKEIGEQGTSHLQGYVYYTNPRGWNSIRKKIGGHIEVAKGNCQQNRDYCAKQGCFKEDGVMPQIQGSRTDIEEVRQILNETGKIGVVANVTTSFQALRFAECAVKYLEPKRQWKPNVYWFYGSTGTGKTKLATEMFPNAIFAMSTAKWWDGYDAHEDVIIDDMRKDFCKFHELLRLLDRYPMRIECKGGSRQFLAKNIVITSCYHPEEMFNTREDINQLIRRIDVIKRIGPEPPGQDVEEM